MEQNEYVVCQEPGILEFKEKSIATPGSGEALIQIRNVGVCGTDIHAFGGNQPYFEYPRILGHELAGDVIKTASNIQGINEGDKVVVMPYMSCGYCYACNRGKTNCCSNIQVLGVHTDGGMQQKFIVPAKYLLPTPELRYDQMAIVEPLAIGAHAIRRSGLKSGDLAVVMGCGPIGIGIMKQAKIAGATVIAIEMDKDRLAFADKLGIDYVLDAVDGPVKHIEDISQGELAACVFDATGQRIALESGLDLMAYGGTYTLVGLSKGNLTFSHPKLHAKESTILCSRNATMEDFEYVVKILLENKFPVKEYITHRIPFANVVDHFNNLDGMSGTVMKAVIDF